MFTCTDSTARKYAGKLVSLAFIRLIKLYADCDDEYRETVELVKEVKTCINTAFNYLINVLTEKECQRNWTKLECYFEMLNEIATSCASSA